ncbi:ANTAR domain-containing response regulator [Labrys wisconsinensis]|uniref:AmiR/NasT family two-component response regulator n=1 Tax=Labrys wisconsinensis TaxID=425677 RepID=A0ABU0J7S1_9HYPH|nr:ANTAR domain-containing protein [Labrys wisconsinensis]MDQ0470300.1 AmiR/NasT family two-component response regulator [Labrys wisconsinensis]
MSATPSFAGWRAAVLHRPDDGVERLVRQLALLGIEADVRWTPLRRHAAFDLVLVDADQGWDGLLPWQPGEAPAPVVALLGSEAPGRIAWAIDQGAGAFIAKPVVASAVYPALVLAASIHAERQAARRRAAILEERLRLRPVVHGAVKAIMAAQGLDEDAAYRCLRRTAMRRRMTLEHVAAGIVAGQLPLPEAG